MWGLPPRLQGIAADGGIDVSRGPGCLTSCFIDGAHPSPVQLLIADFFFILFALGWLGAGLAARSALNSTVRAVHHACLRLPAGPDTVTTSVCCPFA